MIAIKCIVAAVIGALVGALTICALVLAGRNDDLP